MFQRLKTEHWPFLASNGCKGKIRIANSMLSDDNVFPYQFSWANIKGLHDHLHIPD